MLKNIRLLCGVSGPGCGPLGHWLPGHVVEVGTDVDEATAARYVESGLAVPVAVDREAPAAVPPAPPIETETVAAPEAAVLPRGRKKSR